MSKTTGKGFKAALFILIALVCGFLFLHSSIFYLKKIEVTGNQKVSREEIVALSGLVTGNSIFTTSKTITERSVQIHPLVKEAIIKRHIPSTLEIQITERTVWGVIPYNDIYLMVDEEGVCIDKMTMLSVDNDLLITLDEVPVRVNLGQVIEPSAISMIRSVWEELPARHRDQISEFHYLNEEKSLLIYTINGTEVRFGNLERLEEKILAFGEILKLEDDLDKEGKEVLQYVDIRYKGQPVVKTGR
ncbi:MAG: FtsQ-type POTRA domain-containing protein [Bacillota bacterium]|nr:FtsQ-type POTRA domain-containing protein [Bacillota bacterium]